MEEEKKDGGFKLGITLANPTLIEWISAIPEEKRSEAIESTLLAGHFVLNLVQAAAGEDQMERFFRPVVDKMDELKGTLDGIVKASQKSQRLGEMGEEIVRRQLSDAFPGDQFSIVSASGHEADIQAVFVLAPDVTREARVEVKLYSGDVPTKELEKFRADLDTTGVRYGLMVSLASRLMTVQGPMKIEETGGYTAIFVSQSGLDGMSLIAAAALLKAIMAYHARSESARRIPAAAIEQAWQRISDEIEALREVAREVRGFRARVRDVEQVLVSRLGELADSASVAEVKLGAAVDRLVGQLREELEALPAQGDAPALPPPSPPDTVLAALEEMERGKDKRAAAFRRLREVAVEHGADISIGAEGDWSFLRGGREVARTAGTKTRVDLVVRIEPDAPVTIVPSIETVKKGELVIEGRDVDAMIGRAKERLAQ